MEMGGPNGLMRAGWTRNTMKVGDVVAVEGSLARSGRALGNARTVILTSTGQRLFAASSATANP
jgi:acyl-coenzyme A thioesterase PaaI-like protein